VILLGGIGLALAARATRHVHAGEPAKAVPHPRLLFAAEDLAGLRMRAEDTSADDLGLSGALLWKNVLKAAEAALGKPVAPKFEEYAARATARRWAPLALAYAVTGEGKYLEQLRADLRTVLAWDTWGPVGQFSPYTLTIGVTLTLDAAWDKLPEEERKAACGTLVKKGLLPLYEAGKGRKFAEPNSNGRIFYYAALGLGAMLLLGEKEYPDAERWADEACESLKTILDKSDPDGSWAEGIGYGSEAFDGMWGLALLDALKRLRGVDLFAHPFMKNLPHFALHTMRPGGRGGVGFNDTWQQNGFHLVALRAAAEYAMPQCAWYLKEIAYKGGSAEEGVPAVNAFLQYRPGLKPRSPEGTLPLSRHFRGLGWVTCRTSWDDPDGILFAMQTEPLGHYHEHNAMNHFEIHGYGSRLATSPGYHHRRAWRATYGHNLLWVDGKGQNNSMIGKSGGNIVEFTESPFFDYVVGEAHPYGTPKDPLIETWRRHVVFAKPDYLVIFDDVKATGETPREYRWILNVTCAHAIGQKGEFRVSGDTVLALPHLDPAGQLFGKVMLPTDFAAETAMWDEKEFKETYGPYYALTPKQKCAWERFLVVLYPQPRGAPEPRIERFDAQGGQGFEVAVPDGRNLHLYRLEGDRVKGRGLETDGLSCLLGLAADRNWGSYALCDGRELRREGKLLISCDQTATAAFAKWTKYKRGADRLPLKATEHDALHGVANMGSDTKLGFLTSRPPESVLVDGVEVKDAAFDQATGLLSLYLRAGTHQIAVHLRP